MIIISLIRLFLIPSKIINLILKVFFVTIELNFTGEKPFCNICIK